MCSAPPTLPANTKCDVTSRSSFDLAVTGGRAISFIRGDQIVRHHRYLATLEETGTRAGAMWLMNTNNVITVGVLP